MSENLESKAAIKNKILSLADEFSEKPTDFGDDESILELGILDSPGILELICWYEEYFGIQIKNEEINQKNLGTVTLMANFVNIKKGHS